MRRWPEATAGVTERPRAQADGAGRRAARARARQVYFPGFWAERAAVCALVGRRASWESGRNSALTSEQGRRVPDQRRPQEARERERSNPRVVLVGERPSGGSETQCGAEGERDSGGGG